MNTQFKLYTRPEIKVIFGYGDAMIRKLERCGKLHRLPDFPSPRYSPDEVHRLMGLAPKPANENHAEYQEANSF